MHIFLETERLVLRLFTEDDLDNLFNLDSDPDVMGFINGSRPTPLDEVRNEILPTYLRPSHIPGFAQIAAIYPPRAPLGWALQSGAGPVAGTAVFLLSPLAAGIGGAVITVDGGAHSTGAPMLE